MNLHKVELKKMIVPMKEGAAIFLSCEAKTFTMFIGHNEAATIIREMQEQKFIRPLTHDLFHYAMIGFDIHIKRIIISNIQENTFFATLVLEQKVTDKTENWTGKRNEVRIDARPSDSIIMALKTGADIFISDQVLEAVQDITEEMKSMPMLNFETGSNLDQINDFYFGQDDELGSPEHPIQTTDIDSLIDEFNAQQDDSSTADPTDDSPTEDSPTADPTDDSPTEDPTDDSSTEE